MFHIGQQVVCINDKLGPPPGESAPSNIVYPIVGCVYTIRGFTDYGWMIGIVLDEIVNEVLSSPMWHGEPHFASTVFRPVKKTSIEIFQKLLSPTPELVS